MDTLAGLKLVIRVFGVAICGGGDGVIGEWSAGGGGIVGRGGGSTLSRSAVTRGTGGATVDGDEGTLCSRALSISDIDDSCTTLV